MGDPFNRFALRYPAAVVCGLALLLCHGAVRGGPLAVLAPQCPSPWELGKLGFWPVLAAWVLTGRLGRGAPPPGPGPAGGGAGAPAAWRLPAGPWRPPAAAAPGALGSGRGCWRREWPSARTGSRHPELWRGLALLLAGLYMVLTFSPPDWGPFVNPLG